MISKIYKAIDNKGNYTKAILSLKEGNRIDLKVNFKDYELNILNSESIYSGMKKLHKKLDEDGIKLLCNCFRYDVRGTGMSVQMSGGVSAYKFTLGEEIPTILNILDSIEDASAIATLDEQEKYFLKWLESINKSKI